MSDIVMSSPSDDAGRPDSPGKSADAGRPDDAGMPTAPELPDLELPDTSNADIEIPAAILPTDVFDLG